jgi:hypothetical protein
MSRTVVSRRDVLAGLLISPLVAAASGREAAAPASFRLLVHGKLTGAAMQGLQFGVAEAAVTAGLLQRELQLGTSAPGISGAIGVIAADTPASDAVPSNVPVVLLREVAGAAAGPCLFRIGTTRDERDAALARWRAGGPTAAAAHEPRIAEWHPALARYGAKDLNDRFRKQTGEAMTAEAWTAWFAVKALVDSALRATDADRCRALARARLDGHKGRPLRFDAASRVLQQPLYVIAGDAVVAEV